MKYSLFGGYVFSSYDPDGEIKRIYAKINGRELAIVRSNGRFTFSGGVYEKRMIEFASKGFRTYSEALKVLKDNCYYECSYTPCKLLEVRNEYGVL